MEHKSELKVSYDLDIEFFASSQNSLADGNKGGKASDSCQS